MLQIKKVTVEIISTNDSTAQESSIAPVQFGSILHNDELTWVELRNDPWLFIVFILDQNLEWVISLDTNFNQIGFIP